MRDNELKSRPLAKKLRKTMTRAEIVLWRNLRALTEVGYKFRRQHPIGPYVADFAHLSGRLVIEVDGATHWTPEEQEHDRRRTKYLEAQGWQVVRFLNHAVYRDVTSVIEEITRRLPPSVADELRSPRHLPRKRGRTR